MNYGRLVVDSDFSCNVIRIGLPLLVLNFKIEHFF